MTQTAFYALGLLLATFVWGYLFYKKDYHPQPVKVLLQIFGMGLFAMLPVFGYKALYETVLPRISEIRLLQPFAESHFVTAILLFGFNLGLLYLVLFALSGLLTLTLTFFRHETLLNIQRALKDESFDFVAVSLMAAILVFIESGAEKLSGRSIVETALGAILFLGIIEEFVKHLMVRFVDDKKLKDIDDAITLSIMVGLGFALIETLFYSIQNGNPDLLIYRAFLTVPIHLVASGIFGYYYGLAHFAGPICKTEPGNSKLAKALKCRRNTVYYEEKLTEGLFFATLFHTFANLLFEFNLAFLVVPLIVLGIVLLFHLYRTSYLEWRLIEKKA